MTINMNARVRVTLTEQGKAIFIAYYQATDKVFGRKTIAPDDTKTWMLWELFEVFGAHIHMGMGSVPVPFERNCLEIIKEGA